MDRITQEGYWRQRVIKYAHGLGVFGGEGKEEKSDAAQEAISDEMGKAMMMYTPLRTIASFSGGAVTYDMMQALADKINSL